MIFSPPIPEMGIELLMEPGAPGLKRISLLLAVTAKTFSARTAYAMSRIVCLVLIGPSDTAAPVARLIV